MVRVHLFIMILAALVASAEGAVLHVKSATSNADPCTVGTKDDSGDPYGLQGALEHVSPGDSIYVWADGVYDLDASIVADLTDDVNSGTNSGGTVTWVYITGANSVGGVDGTRPQITGSDLAHGLFWFQGDTAAYHKYTHINFDSNGVADYCIYNAGDSNDAYNHVHFEDCIFQDADEDGVTSAAGFWSFWRCEFTTADDDGFESTDSAASNYVFYACSFHDNGDDGAVLYSSYARVTRCLFYDNGGDGLDVGSLSDYLYLVHNTAYGNGAGGYTINTGSDLGWCANNTSCGNTTQGYILGNDDTRWAFFGYNHANGNSAHTDIVADGSWAALMNGNNVSAAPVFGSVTDGSEDFEPQTGSGLLANGLPGAFIAGGTAYTTIGAVEPEQASGSGGGRRSHMVVIQ